MRKHGWQLPYHPLQVVAVAVFLALGFAFYVFFAPFVGRRLFQYIAVGLYTPLIISVFSLYIWCAAADPADPGVFKSKKYLKISDSKIHTQLKEAKLGGDLTPSLQDENAVTIGGKHVDKSSTNVDASVEDHSSEIEKTHASSHPSSCFKYLLAFVSCASLCHCSSFHDESSEHQPSEDGMFYCSLCEVEVFKYSKHCRVCDKCVNRFDHHCRWLNNCIGRKNYRQFFTLMVTALVLLILQWTTGILVLISCILEHKRFSVDIASKLGSSFTLPPFIIVVGMCSILAMIATLPLAQLFFFHILLIKKGISTYDYIIALREQEHQGAGGQQSPQMSPASSLTGLSSASSFNTFQRTAWCTPPRLFLEDQFDVVPPDTGSVSSLGKKSARDEPIKKKNPGAVKISPWALARLNAEEVSRVAAEARKKSKILQPVSRRNNPPGPGTDSSFGSGDRRMGTKLGQIPDSNSSRRRPSKRVRLPAGLIESSGSANGGAGYNMGNDFIPEPSTSLAPLQLEARNAFRTSLAMSGPAGVVGSSPESSLESPDLHPFRISSSGPDEGRQLAGPLAAQKGFPLSRSTSDGYEASGGEDSDRVPSRNVERTMNWSNLLFRADRDERPARLKGSTSSSGQVNLRNL